MNQLSNYFHFEAAAMKFKTSNEIYFQNLENNVKNRVHAYKSNTFS